MKHKVVYPFIDSDGKKYRSGDIYTNKDTKRIKQLATTDNKRKKVLIAPIKSDEEKKEPVKTNKKVDGAPEEENTK